MKNIISKLINSNKKKTFKDIEFLKLKNCYEVSHLFNCFMNFDEKTEIRFVGGCVRKILNEEKIDDLDLATNVNPNLIIEILKKNKINYFSTGIKHGTITAIINDKKFEITSLRKDIKTDGRHAEVMFTDDWYADAARRDFSINSIYSDLSGNLYDPFNGMIDLKKGLVKFIGNAEDRIQEDYLRILRYIRFHLNYSEIDHEVDIKKVIKKNISGIKKLSKNRLIDELKKIFLSPKFYNLAEDQFSQEVVFLIFPELKNLSIFNKLSSDQKNLILNKDFIFLISLSIIDNTDNADYFVFKYNISNQEKKKILFLKNNYKNISKKNFFEYKNISKIHYLNGTQMTIDLIDFKILQSSSYPKKLLDLKRKFINKEVPVFPLKAKNLINEYNFKEGRELGEKLKILENVWIDNNFNITDAQIKKIVLN